MDKKQVMNAATACADWFVANQIVDRMDANKGRFIRCLDMETGYSGLTGNWQTGTAACALLAMYNRTQESKYLEAAESAGRYLMSLQVMDPRDKRYYGVIREITPQSIEYAPRDATSAAWALVWLYNITKDEQYLDRAVLFADWHLEYAMYRGWPLYAQYMDADLPNFFARGSFQSGTGLFYHDLFRATDDTRYIERGLLPIARTYVDDFIRPDGGLVQQRDIFTNKPKEEMSSQHGLHVNMHMYNDDFGAPMLMAASELFDDNRYIDKARAYAVWLAEHQDPDGGFEGGAIHSGVPVSLMYFHDLGLHYNDTTLLSAKEKALSKLLSTQFGKEDPELCGAFIGRYENGDEGSGAKCTNTRTNSYALIALLKIESDLEDIWLGRFNGKFIDPLLNGVHDLRL